MSSDSRLVARMMTPGQARSSQSASRAHDSTRCSQLSQSSSRRLDWSESASDWRSGRSASSRTPRTPATACVTRAGSASAASSVSHAPSGNPSSASAATWRARRVLPAPPVPVSVKSRVPPSRARASRISASRPTNDVSWAGRLCAKASRERNGGKPSARPGARSAKTSWGWARSFSRCRPRECSDASPGISPSSRAAPASETSVCPPCAAASRRAARLRGRPK
jgi:hypothetical protein